MTPTTQEAEIMKVHSHQGSEIVKGCTACPRPHHTPTPWIVVLDTLRELKPSIMSAEHGEEIALLENRADAELIRRAVNCHEELVNFLKSEHKKHMPKIAKDYKGCQLIAKAERK